MLRNYLVLALLIWLTGPAVAASPDPKSLVVPEDVLSKARELVQQLGSEQFAEREEAELALAKLGRAARAALLDGANTDPNAEVRTRCQTLLPKATTLEMKARIEVFLADSEGKFDHDLPGWNELRSVVRSEWTLFGYPVWSDRSLDKAARVVFADLISTQANRHIMMAVGGQAENLAATASARRQELYSQAFPRAVVVNGMVSTSTRKQPTLADMTALLLAEALTDGKAGGGRATSITSLISTSGFTAAVQAQDAPGRVYRSIAASWIETRRDPMDMYYATTIARSLGMTDAGIRVAIRLFETKGAIVSYRGLAAQTLAQLGTKEHIPLLEKAMGDSTVLTTVRRSVIKDGKAEIVAHDIQLRDTALAVSLVLAGQKPEEYGFVDQYKASGVTGVNFSYTRFYMPEEERKAAFEKWKEWRAKNP